MISQRVRESRRVKSLKLPKNIERLYKEGKCRDCAVVVTRMDFAKILGKFTKVKIQYESSSTPKTKKDSEVVSPNSNARLKSNENGMVLIHRNAYSQHPVKELLSTKKPKATPVPTSTPRQTSNVLKENNRLKKTPIVKDKNSNINISSSNLSKKKNNLQLKEYGIVFTDPLSDNTIQDAKSNISLSDLLPSVNKNILPSDEWSIDYLPHSEEAMEDKVYDRIAAELEDLMYNEKPVVKDEEKIVSTENKVEEFPSIMDILNDNSNDSVKTTEQSAPDDFKPSLESSDVEAMLLGKSNSINKDVEPSSMDVDNSVMSNLIEDVEQLNDIQPSEANSEADIKIPEPIIGIDNPHMPSIIDEALQKGIEEHLPCDPTLPEVTEEKNEDSAMSVDSDLPINGIVDTKTEEVEEPLKEKELDKEKPNPKITVEKPIPSNITHLIFRKNVNGECLKSVICPRNLEYHIELEGKTVEFLGAPNSLSSLEDLQVLLQIVNETEPKSFYVIQ